MTAKKHTPLLVIDVGGSHVKIVCTDDRNERKFISGPDMTAKQMVAGVLKLAKGWKYEGVSIGYPGPVLHNRPVSEPYELGDGWVGFDFEGAFGCPVILINDAAMQALGSYEGGKMLFLGLGTGLGSTMIADGYVEPMELGHLPYKKRTYEDYLGKRGLKRLGKKKWRMALVKILSKLLKALEPDYVVIGGGNARKLKHLPEKCRLGENADAFKGGFLMWADTSVAKSSGRAKSKTKVRPLPLNGLGNLAPPISILSAKRK
jgi:polyphosphate glucokinase